MAEEKKMDAATEEVEATEEEKSSVKERIAKKTARPRNFVRRHWKGLAAGAATAAAAVVGGVLVGKHISETSGTIDLDGIEVPDLAEELSTAVGSFTE